MTIFAPRKPLTILLTGALLLVGFPALGQDEAGPERQPVDGSLPLDIQAPADDSTVVYPAEFFAPYSPVSVNDMLDRIPGVSVSGRSGGGRGLGTGGDLLINGQRLAGKDISPRDQLDRIAAREVEQIEIIRGTSGALDVRGSSQVINVVLTDVASRTSTSMEAVGRRNHDGQYELGGSLSHSRQTGGFQALFSLDASPGYENRISRETIHAPDESLIGTLHESNVRDRLSVELSGTMSYRVGAHRLQFNSQYGDSSYPRTIQRDFRDRINDEFVSRREDEITDYDRDNWEVGGEYEYSFASGQRAQFLFIVNDQTRGSERERFRISTDDPSAAEREKTLFIASNQRTQERIGQGNYSFSFGDGQSLRLGLEQAQTLLDSSLRIGNAAGSGAASPDFGGLPPRPDLSNPGTRVEEMRHEGFAFHNWTLSRRLQLESSLVYETSEISQSGQVNTSRRFNFFRPAVDLRFDVTNALQLRASAERDISQLSFANFAATTNTDDRERDADAGNPELVPEKDMRYELGVEYRLPNDNGVLESRVIYRVTDDYIGRINATRDPEVPLSAIGNIGSAERWGFFNDVSTRLSYIGLPDAIFSAGLRLFDSRVTDPFLDEQRRISDRGWATAGFRHDVTQWRLNYGFNYRYPFHGGRYETDITTITRNDNNANLNLFVSMVLLDDVTFRLESNNTLDDYRCRERERYAPSIMSGDLQEIQRSCSSRYRRLTLRVQTTF